MLGFLKSSDGVFQLGALTTTIGSAPESDLVLLVSLSTIGSNIQHSDIQDSDNQNLDIKNSDIHKSDIQNGINSTRAFGISYITKIISKITLRLVT